MSVRREIPAVGVAALAVLARPADAHLVSTELGPFYDGAAHTVVSPGDLLTIVALAVLASFVGPAAGRRLLLALTGGWAIGASVSFGALASEITVPLAAPALLLLLGLLGVLKARLPVGLLLLGGVLVALLLGLLNGTAARVEEGQWLTVLGMVVGVFVVSSMLLAAGIWVEKRGWTVVLRVAASWIAAIGLLLLGWTLQAQ